MKIQDLHDIVRNLHHLTKPTIFYSQKEVIKTISGYVVSQDVASAPEKRNKDFFSHLNFNRMSITERLFFTAMEQHIGKDDIKSMTTMMPRKSSMPFLVQITENIRLGKEQRR